MWLGSKATLSSILVLKKKKKSMCGREEGRVPCRPGSPTIPANGGFLLETPGENQLPCLFQLLDASGFHGSWPFLLYIFRANSLAYDPFPCHVSFSDQTQKSFSDFNIDMSSLGLPEQDTLPSPDLYAHHICKDPFPIQGNTFT